MPETPAEPDLDQLHRRFGVKLNNETWDRLDQIDAGTPDPDPEHLLYSAYATCFHWLEAGDEANHARAEHLIAHVAIAIGRTDVALEHARRGLALATDHPAVMADWDAPMAHEAVARALAATGDRAGAEQHLTRATELATAVTDPEDRAVVEETLAKPPWFGLR